MESTCDTHRSARWGTEEGENKALEGPTEDVCDSDSPKFTANKRPLNTTVPVTTAPSCLLGYGGDDDDGDDGDEDDDDDGGFVCVP